MILFYGFFNEYKIIEQLSKAKSVEEFNEVCKESRSSKEEFVAFQ
jgi:hypothetical protein